MNRTKLMELGRLHDECGWLYERVSRPVMSRLMALENDAFEAELARGLVPGPTGCLAPREPTPAEEQLLAILDIRKVACYRPYLERAAKLHNIQAPSLKQILARLVRP